MPLTDIKSVKNGVKVMYPDSTIAQSTYKGCLKGTLLPLSAKKVHLFNHLASGSLLSLGQLCDAGCTADFDKEYCYIQYKGEVIMKVIRRSSNGLWQIEQDTEPNLSKDIISINAVIDRPTMAERITFLHASPFLPTLTILVKAIESEFLLSFSAVIVAQLQKFPPRSQATVKGHMRALPTKQKM